MDRFHHIRPGVTCPSLGRNSKSLYTIVAVTDKGFTLSRANGSQAKVTFKACVRALEALEQAPRAFQGNFNAGGLCGTSMIRDGIMFAIGAVKDGAAVRLAQADSEAA